MSGSQAVKELLQQMKGNTWADMALQVAIVAAAVLFVYSMADGKDRKTIWRHRGLIVLGASIGVGSGGGVVGGISGAAGGAITGATVGDGNTHGSEALVHMPLVGALGRKRREERMNPVLNWWYFRYTYGWYGGRREDVLGPTPSDAVGGREELAALRTTYFTSKFDGDEGEYHEGEWYFLSCFGDDGGSEEQQEEAPVSVPERAAEGRLSASWPPRDVTPSPPRDVTPSSPPRDVTPSSPPQEVRPSSVRSRIGMLPPPRDVTPSPVRDYMGYLHSPTRAAAMWHQGREC